MLLESSGKSKGFKFLSFWISHINRIIHLQEEAPGWGHLCPSAYPYYVHWKFYLILPASSCLWHPLRIRMQK
ncbi:MAG: ABC-2 family transporter protein [Chitinophagaceae bacterium]